MLDTNKNDLNKSRMGWLALGMLFDYLIGQPIRKILPIILIIIGFHMGSFYTNHILPNVFYIMNKLLFGN